MKGLKTVFIMIFMAGLYIPLLYGNVQAKFELKAKESTICFQCHQDIKDGLSSKHVHQPFRQGKCTACHEVHASKHKGLIKSEINNLCLRCHEDLKRKMQTEKVHGALRGGICTDCHLPHSGENNALLVKPEKEICFKCHKSLKEFANKSYKHQPFDTGSCSSCHNAHVAKEDNLLSAPSGQLCQQCHAPGCNVGGVSITKYTSQMECVSCHTGHNTNIKGLLGPFGHPAFLDKQCIQCHEPFVEGKRVTTKESGMNLCFTCHDKKTGNYNEEDVHLTFKDNPCTLCHDYHASNKKNLTVNEKSLCITCHEDVNQGINHMVKRFKDVNCKPVKERECLKCHAPVHAKSPYFFKEDSDVIKTCATCHEREHKIAHPLGNGVTDPRDGSTITCKTCHSMHFAKAEFLLRFDRNRELCIQCHKMP